MSGAEMENRIKRLVTDEKGAAMVLALILLLVGGLIVTPLLAHMGSGILAGEVYEKRTAELYAADAGVEDAIWKIHNQDKVEGAWPCNPSSPPFAYNITDVNGKRVQISVKYIDGSTYRITSIAITDSEGDAGIAAIDSTTAVEAYVSATYMDFSSFLDNAIVSDESITIYNGVSVTGNVTSGGTVEDKTRGDVNGTITEGADLEWPTADELSTYYLSQMGGAVHYDGDTELDLDGNSCPPGPIYKTIDGIEEEVFWLDGLGPLKVNGELDVTSSAPHQDVNLKLNDTLYITGDTKIYGPTEADPSELTIDLNGQTIFVASPTAGGHNAFEIGKCNIIGSGCIIAVGDINFAPKGEVGGEGNFVLVMSIEGTTTLHPSGIFYGCIAGNLAVDAQSGNNATIINYGLGEDEDLNFPMGDDDPNKLPPVTAVRIDSWEVIQQ